MEPPRHNQNGGVATLKTVDTDSILGTETLFGGLWYPAGAAASVLRARASRFGAQLSPTALPHQVAAVIGADLWLFAFNTPSFDQPQRYGHAGVAALSAVLSRAAGYVSPITYHISQEKSETTTNLLNRCSAYLQYLENLELPPKVLLWAASDLAAGALHPQLARAITAAQLTVTDPLGENVPASV